MVAFLESYRPNCDYAFVSARLQINSEITGVIHCAAQTRPDVVDKVKYSHLPLSLSIVTVTSLNRTPQELGR